MKNSKKNNRWLFVFAILICVTYTSALFGQTTSAEERTMDSLEISFRDTIYDFVFDSLKHDLGAIDAAAYHSQLTKYFKYIGKAPITITRAWTGDPHFICQFPNEPLIPNQIYPFTICFSHKGRVGTMSKQMGFELSDGRRITLQFKGHYTPHE